MEEYIISNTLINNCSENDKDLFKDIKKQRGNNVIEDVTIDGTSGDEIPKKFASIYEELFNRKYDDPNILDI